MRLLQKRRRSPQRAGEPEPLPPSKVIRRCLRKRLLLCPVLLLGRAKGALSLRSGRERRQQQCGRRLLQLHSRGHVARAAAASSLRSS